MLKTDPYLKIEKPSIHNMCELNEGSNKHVVHYQQLGFKHLGFYDNFEGMQPRHTFQISTSTDYKSIADNMSSHAKRNIKFANKQQCLSIKEATIADLEEFYNLLCLTATRDKFGIRDISYFKQLVTELSDQVRLTLAQVDLELLASELRLNSERLQKQLSKLEAKNASPNQISNISNQITANSERLRETEKLLESGVCKMYLAANLSFTSDLRMWYLYGASSDCLKFLKSPYLLMDEMIHYAVDNNYEYYDLYGVSGVFEKSHPDYGLYQFKSGLGGELVEFIGEFDLVLNKPLYFGFRHLYPRLKKFRKRQSRK